MEPAVDVEGMRQTAASLRDRAAALGTVGARLDAQLAEMSYAGPAADRFRSTVTDRRQRVARAAAELQSMADTLTRAAFAAEASVGPMGGQG